MLEIWVKEEIEYMYKSMFRKKKKGSRKLEEIIFTFRYRMDKR